ncbi:MAG: alpha/beta hydrolase, partial [Muribaculaceae bacterium]
YSFKLIKRLLPVFVGKQKALTMIDKYRAKAGSSDYNSSTQKMRSIMSRVVNEDLKGYMPKISCPTLLIWGALDTATPIGDAKIMERLIPDAGLVSFEGVGHYSFLENPYGFDAVLKSFLEKDMTNNK